MKNKISIGFTAGLLFLAACSSPTRYVADPEPGLGHFGYSEVRIDSVSYEVTFSGNYETAPQTVEQYTLYRAAELTVGSGFDYFVVVHTQTATMHERRHRDLTMTKTIRMLHGQAPKNKANVYDAHDMLQAMTPSIQRD